MKIKNDVKVRKEDGFYLIINLSTESVIKGLPSFFKINEVGNIIIEMLKERSYNEREVLERFVDTSISQASIVKFLDFLKEYDLCYE